MGVSHRPGLFRFGALEIQEIPRQTGSVLIMTGCCPRGLEISAMLAARRAGTPMLPRFGEVGPHAHQGPFIPAPSRVVGVLAIAKCLFARGGSLFVTGLAGTNPHRMARVNALETMPATFRTVFAERGRACFVIRWCPPPFTADSIRG